MNHRIDVSFINGRVHVDTNPLYAYPRNFVTWYLPGYRPDLQVEFSAVRDLTTPPLLPIGPNGPFVSLNHLGDRIVGMIADFPQPDKPEEKSEGDYKYRFFYKILEDGIPLEWDSSVEFGNATLGGGVDVPAKPPTALDGESGLPTTS